MKFKSVRDEINELEALYAPYPIGEAYKKFHNKDGTFKAGVEMKDVLKQVEQECKKDERKIAEIYQRIGVYLRQRN